MTAAHFNQEREPHTGRYSHNFTGVVAQDSRGDIEGCSGCGALRAWTSTRWVKVDPATVAPEAYFGAERDAWRAAHPDLNPYDIAPVRKAVAR